MNIPNMKLRNISIVVVVLLILDQALKIWIKTHMCLGESIVVIPDWFQLRFIENSGAAFGMRIASDGAFDWGKIALSLFRIVLIGLLIYYVWYLSRKRRDVPKGVFIGLALIVAGAVGNMLDSAFYGLIFSTSTPMTPAHFGDGPFPAASQSVERLGCRTPGNRTSILVEIQLLWERPFLVRYYPTGEGESQL